MLSYLRAAIYSTSILLVKRLHKPQGVYLLTQYRSNRWYFIAKWIKSKWKTMPCFQYSSQKHKQNFAYRPCKITACMQLVTGL